MHGRRHGFIRRLFLPITLHLGRKNLQEVHFKPANQARRPTFASDKTRAVRAGKSDGKNRRFIPLQKGKNAIIRGNGRWRGIREADYKRTKAGDKDKGDSALTVLSVRYLVHSIFGTRCFSIRGTILFQNILLRIARCSLFGKFAGYADKEAAGST